MPNINRAGGPSPQVITPQDSQPFVDRNLKPEVRKSDELQPAERKQIGAEVQSRKSTLELQGSLKRSELAKFDTPTDPGSRIFDEAGKRVHAALGALERAKGLFKTKEQKEALKTLQRPLRDIQQQLSDHQKEYQTLRKAEESLRNARTNAFLAREGLPPAQKEAMDALYDQLDGLELQLRVRSSEIEPPELKELRKPVGKPMKGLEDITREQTKTALERMR